jgi:23S rRNA pseudouridine2605 synthase
MPTRNEGSVRLQVYLARAGLGSRRACELLVTDGRVRVEGRVVRELGSKVAAADRVEVDGKPVHPQAHVYLAVNKPPGYVCSNRKMDERPLLSELYRSTVSGRLYPVGRLDVLSSGLILVTNDGDFANGVMHPSREVEKEYLVDTVDPVQERTVENWVRGVTIDGVRYAIRSAVHHSPTRLSLTLVEGKNREIRRILEGFGIRARRVHRVRIGPVALRGLPPGAFRPLSAQEIRALSGRATRPGTPPAASPRRPKPPIGRRGNVHKNAQRRPRHPLT